MAKHIREEDLQAFFADEEDAEWENVEDKLNDEEDLSAERPMKAPRHGRHAAAGAASFKNSPLFDKTDEFDFEGDYDAADNLGILPPEASGAAASGRPSSDVAEEKELHPEVVKSKKARRKLTVIAILVVLLICAVAAAIVFAIMHSNNNGAETAQQVSGQSAATDETLGGATDAQVVASKKIEVPNLVSVMGKTQDEAIELIGHDARVGSTTEEDDEDSDIKTTVQLLLYADPSDSHAGLPTVTLGLDEDGKVIQIGYSASTILLGYGSVSFSDAVLNQHVIENTLAEAGVNAASDAIALPEDKAEYSTYDTKTINGQEETLLVKEKYSFSGAPESLIGEGEVGTWSAVLMYDYSNSNVSGNLNDTIRMIYVYLDK